MFWTLDTHVCSLRFIWSCVNVYKYMWGGKKRKRINLLYSFSPYRFFSSLSFYRLSAFHHNQADLKRFIHMRQPLRNYFGSDLSNTIEDMFASLGGISMEEWSVGDGVWSWLSGNFCYRFCYRFVSRRFSQFVVRGTYEYLIYSYKC